MTQPTSPPLARCPDCGAPIRAELCAGLCPACLAGAIFGAVETPVPAEQTPQRCGDYELLEKIAQGGMGTVWKARKRGVDRVVALKLVRENWLPGEEAARRFRQEGAAAGRLQHPHIVAVHDVGEADGAWFIIMEWIDGPSLAQRLRDRRCTERESVTLVAQLAHALHHAHERGVLHRDVKPGNVLLDAAAAPHLADFGLAKVVEHESDLTLAGVIFGTPAYMSPEQARGRHEEVTTTSDLYSLGAIFYELLAGHPPFTAAEPVELLRRVCEDEAPPPTADRDLATICLKCLEKTPHARYGSALALAEDLERWLRGEPILVRPLSGFERLGKWARRRPLHAALWAVSIFAVGAIIVLLASARTRIDRERRAAVAHAEMSQHRLARQFAQTGLRMIEAGDWHLALLPLAEAVDTGAGEPSLDRANRLRFESLVRLAPRLAQMWFPVPAATGVPLRLLSAQGAVPFLLVVDEHGTRIWDATTGTPLSPPADAAIWPGIEPGMSFAGGIGRFGDRIVAETGKNRGDRFRIWIMPDGILLPEQPGTLPTMLHGSAAQPPGLEVASDQLIAWRGTEAQHYSTSTGLPVGPPLGHDAVVKWAAQAPGSKHHFTFTVDGKLRIWNEAASLAVPPLEFAPSTTLHAIDRTRPWLSLHSDDSRLAMVNFLTGTTLATARTNGTVFAESWNRDGRWIYAERAPEGVKVRDAASGFLIFSAAHGSRGYSAQFSQDAAETLTVGLNGTAQIWRTKDGQALTPVLRCGGFPHTSAITADGMSAVIDSDESAARLWRRREFDGAEREFATESEALEVWFSGGQLFAACQDGRVLSWEVATGAPCGAPLLSAGPLEEGRISSGGGYLLTAGDQSLQRWDLARGTAAGAKVTTPEGFRFATLSADGTRIGAVLGDGTGALFDPANGQRIGGAMGQAAERCAFSADGRALLLIAAQTVQSWDPASGVPRSPVLTDGAGRIQACFSPDGQRILTWGLDRKRQVPRAARLWDALTGAPLGSPMLHRDGIIDATFSADGTRIITGSEDQTAVVWDARSGQALTAPTVHPGPVEGAGFSPDGASFWTLCGPHARIWETATGEPITPPLRHPKSARVAAWSPDGEWLASVGGTRGVRLWNLSAGTRSSAEMKGLARMLSAHALAPGGIGATLPLNGREVRAAWEESRDLQQPPPGGKR